MCLYVFARVIEYRAPANAHTHHDGRACCLLLHQCPGKYGKGAIGRDQQRKQHVSFHNMKRKINTGNMGKKRVEQKKKGTINILECILDCRIGRAAALKQNRIDQQMTGRATPPSSAVFSAALASVSVLFNLLLFFYHKIDSIAFHRG